MNTVNARPCGFARVCFTTVFYLIDKVCLSSLKMFEKYSFEPGQWGKNFKLLCHQQSHYNGNFCAPKLTLVHYSTAPSQTYKITLLLTNNAVLTAGCKKHNIFKLFPFPVFIDGLN